MRTVTIACLVAAALVAGHLRLVAAENARLRHLVAVYFDEKEAGFKLPEGVACDARGQLVVADTGNDRLVRFSFREKKLSGGREIRVSQLSAPLRVQLNSKGEIYALDGKQRRIVHLGPEGEFKAVLAMDGAPPPATIVPKSFAIDATDSVYVLDVFSARVLVLNAQGRFQRALPLPDSVGFATALAVDTAGTVFLLDSIKRRLFSAAKDAAGFAALGGDLSGSVATMPASLTASAGILFVAEGSGSSIVAFGRDGSFLARQLTMGWEDGALNHPAQMCVNDKDEVFIADRDNSRVQIFQLLR
jgi:NHL repeat